MTGNGHVIPGTPIAIDRWNIKSCPQARIFFLTHFHADHIVGLTSSWQYPIYASPITCKFLIHKIKIDPSLVKSLEIGEDHLISIDLDGQEMLTVTLFDANHCPGSVMLLLSGYFGDILYTGDFRYQPDMFGDFQMPPIDVLYLDNTYCSPRCIFPSREDAIEKILSQLHVCLVQSDRVFLGLDNLGKEDLLLQIAKETHSKICVKPARKVVMDLLNLSDIVTTDQLSSKVFVVATNQISGKNITQWNKEMKTHAILATARFCGFNFKPYSKFSNIHVIPYSNHSSFSELKKFVKQMQPSAVVPIVSKQAKGMFGADISDRADMNIFQEFLRSSIPYEHVIPESVKRAMNIQESKSCSNLPFKRRKIARKTVHPVKRLPVVGIRYIVSEDSETDSDPEAVHILPKNPALELNCSTADTISEFSSSHDSDEDSDWTWEVICIKRKGQFETSITNQSTC